MKSFANLSETKIKGLVNFAHQLYSRRRSIGTSCTIINQHTMNHMNTVGQDSKKEPSQNHLSTCTGWWCRGCGGIGKIEALKEFGLNTTQAEEIYDIQFGSCSDLLIPCYICNRYTRKQFDETTCDADFWNED